MTDLARKEYRIGVISVVAALLAVAAWWTLILPGISKYKAHQREAKLKEKLQSIKPPAGGQSGKINILYISSLDSILAMRIDVGQSDCTAAGVHYRNVFANAGFGYNGEQVDSKQHALTFSFANPDYDARVTCNEVDSHVFFYGINMHTR